MVKAKLYRQNHTKKHTHTHSQNEQKEKVYIFKKKEVCVGHMRASVLSPDRTELKEQLSRGLGLT